MKRICFVFLIGIILITGCSVKTEPSEEDPLLKDGTSLQNTINNEINSSTIFPKVMFLQGMDIIRFFPDDKSDPIKEINDSYVTVYNIVHNAEKEEWAVVEYIDEVNQKHHGYVLLERLSDRPKSQQ